MDKYIIDRPENCETWFLWENGEVLKTGDLETVMEFLERKENRE